MNQSTHRYSHVVCCARCIPLMSNVNLYTAFS